MPRKSKATPEPVIAKPKKSSPPKTKKIATPVVELTNQWYHNLPDTAAWQPQPIVDSFAQTLALRCQSLEDQLLASDEGNRVNLLRQELKQLLPTRYTVQAGTLDDRLGQSAGDYEVVISNGFWFPTLHSADLAKKPHIPIEAAYAVVDITPSLDFATLDQAMERLVKVHRLLRPSTSGDQLAENRILGDCVHSTSNPLFSAIIAPGLAAGVEMDDVINRFFEISRKLGRKELIRALCILGQGTLTWSVMNEEGECQPALFMEDLDQSLVPSFHRPQNTASAFYPLVVNLLGHLSLSVLGVEDLFGAYAARYINVLGPSESDIRLEPDQQD